VKHPEKVSASLKDADVDTCYCPIIMSGGNFNLKPSAQSDEKPLAFGVIIASLGNCSVFSKPSTDSFFF
jgi:nucleosome binding factor SPN SPT16 subunit